jgi:transcriptional regulator with XRE-family HTH domain
VAEAVLVELGKRVRARRKALGLAQDELALVADMDRSYVGRVERGEQNISFSLLCRLCVALQCDVAALTKNIPIVAHA